MAHPFFSVCDMLTDLQNDVGDILTLETEEEMEAWKTYMHALIDNMVVQQKAELAKAAKLAEEESEE